MLLSVLFLVMTNECNDVFWRLVQIRTVYMYGEAFIFGGRGDSGDTDMLKCVLLFVCSFC